ncbi:hypothetical protein F0U59_50260 [Archangium gephyra]|nr:hypothetical protein F0U59_50260 [Archangium gephyra]
MAEQNEQQKEGLARSSGVPFIARVAGLPAQAMEPFTGERCTALLARMDQIAARQAELRPLLADQIFNRLTQTEPALRRYLLELKRDSFNGRSLERYSRSPHWERVQPDLERLPEQLLALEREQTALEQALPAAYLEDRERGLRWLLEQARKQHFQRGVSLASPGLVEYLGRLYDKPLTQYGRRERKTEQSLLRYFSRAAVKLSPYSTFTRLGLGLMGEVDSQTLVLREGPWRERSLVRAKRYLLDQCREFLFQHPRVREQLGVRLNDTLQVLGDGQRRFLRPTALVPNPATGELEYSKPSLVKARLGGPLIAWLEEQLGHQSQPYAELRQRISSTFDEAPERVEATLNKLVDVGFLSLAPPWSTLEIHLEKRLGEFLGQLPVEAGLAPVTETLKSLVALENGYAEAQEPLRTVQGIDEQMSLLFEQIKAATRPGSALNFEKKSQKYYEDVLAYADAETPPTRELMRMSHDTARELMSTAGLLWRVACLFEPRHDFHHALWEFVAQRMPGRNTIPVLELFAEVQPLWEQYLAFMASAGHQTFDPYGLPELAELKRLRQQLMNEMESIQRFEEGEMRTPLDELRRLVERVPARYAHLVDPCIFTQPADARGERWVVNRFFEGGGRFGSRFTAVMDGAMLDTYVSHYERCSRFQVEGESAELLDMLFTRGNTVNLHWPQTPRVLELPGEYSQLPDSRRLQLKDLVLHTDPQSRRFILRDQRGQRYIPTYLSPLQNEFVPSILKFLDIFGTMARGAFPLRTRVEKNQGVTVAERLCMGRLIVRRKRWVVEAERLPRLGRSDSESFLAIHRWRRELGLPERVYLIEKVTAEFSATDIYKPQYIDFRSPALVSLLQLAMEHAEGSITLEEALPEPEAFPADPRGQRWGVELILDSLALHSG